MFLNFKYSTVKPDLILVKTFALAINARSEQQIIGFFRINLISAKEILKYWIFVVNSIFSLEDVEKYAVLPVKP